MVSRDANMNRITAEQEEKKDLHPQNRDGANIRRIWKFQASGSRQQQTCSPVRGCLGAVMLDIHRALSLTVIGGLDDGYDERTETDDGFSKQSLLLEFNSSRH